METPIPPTQTQDLSKGYFSAILAANRDNCQCKACIILRKVSETIENEFTKS